MNNGQYKRLIFSIIFAIVLLGVTIALLFAVLNKPKDVQNYVGQNGKDGQSIVGPVGPIGATGVGIAGKDGTDAQPIINNFTTNIPIPGPQGSTGNPGTPARQIHLQVNSICQLESQYDGDDNWQILAQLPTPCTVEASND